MNPEIDARVSDAEVQLKAAQAEYDAYALSGQAELAAVSQEKLDSAIKQLALLKEQQSRLVITAPASGTVVGTAASGGHDCRADAGTHASWSGTPLTDRNIGAFLEPQTHISSIAPSDKLQAVLVMDQTEREVLSRNRPVRLKLEGLPTLVWDGKITEISHRHLEFAPPGLSNQFQGPLVTVPDEQAARSSRA